MIINQSVGFTFIHIPKSAGTSVTQFLAPLNGPFDLEIGGTPFGEALQAPYWNRHRVRKHSTLSEVLSIIEKSPCTKDIFIFSFVRNPYDRLASIFSFLRKWQDYNPDLRKIMNGFSDFEAFVRSGIYTDRPGPDRIFRPQCEWLKVDGTIPTNLSWFKIEEIDAAIEEIRREILARKPDLTNEFLSSSFPHANRSQSSPPKYFALPHNLLLEIEDFYKEDFINFNYKRPLEEAKYADIPTKED